MKTETKPMKYLRLYRWLRGNRHNNGYAVKVARISARLQAGYSLSGDKYWSRYWKFR